MKTHLHHSRPFYSFVAPMCTARSPPPLPPDRAPAEPQLLFDVVSFTTRGRRRERKRRLGGERGRVICGCGKRHRFGRRGQRLRPSCRRRRTKEAAKCKRLTRAQTTWPFTVDAAVPTPQRSVPPARGEGEGNLSRTRRRAHQSVSVKSLHCFTLHLQSTWNQRVAKQKW